MFLNHKTRTDDLLKGDIETINNQLLYVNNNKTDGSLSDCRKLLNNNVAKEDLIADSEGGVDSCIYLKTSN